MLSKGKGLYWRVWWAVSSSLGLYILTLNLIMVATCQHPFISPLTMVTTFWILNASWTAPGDAIIGNRKRLPYRTDFSHVRRTSFLSTWSQYETLKSFDLIKCTVVRRKPTHVMSTTREYSIDYLFYKQARSRSTKHHERSRSKHSTKRCRPREKIHIHHSKSWQSPTFRVGDKLW